MTLSEQNRGWIESWLSSRDTVLWAILRHFRDGDREVLHNRAVRDSVALFPGNLAAPRTSFPVASVVAALDQLEALGMVTKLEPWPPQPHGTYHASSELREYLREGFTAEVDAEGLKALEPMLLPAPHPR